MATAIVGTALVVIYMQVKMKKIYLYLDMNNCHFNNSVNDNTNKIMTLGIIIVMSSGSSDSREK